jgi:hypothetical protein
MYERGTTRAAAAQCVGSAADPARLTDSWLLAPGGMTRYRLQLV